MKQKIGVLLGRFQPFHRGHQQLITEMLLDNDKVYIFVAGNGKDKEKNPIPYWLRKLSIRLINKVKIIKADVGFLPTLIDENISYEKTRVRVYSTGDRVGSYSSQFSEIWKIYYNVEFVEHENRFGEVSGTGVRKLVKENHQQQFYDSLPNLYSDITKFILFKLYRFYLKG